MQPGMRVGQVIDASLKLYRAKFPDLMLIALIVAVPIDAIGGVLNDLSLPSQVFVHDGRIYYYLGESVGPLGTIWRLVGDLLIYPLGTGALLKCLLDAHAGRPSSWRSSLRFAAARWGALLWLAILTGLGLVLFSILLIIPGIYMYVCWYVAVPVLMFEGITGTGAMSRSRGLVSGRWWPTFGIAIITVLAAVVVEVVAVLVIGLVMHSMSSVGPIIVLQQVAQVLFHLISAPLFAAVAAIVYVDLRTRKEGFDLELLAEALGRGEPLSAAPAFAAFGAGDGPEPSAPASVPPPSGE
jgi:hypothetical protein